MSIIIIFNLPKIGVGWARTTMKLSCFPNCIFRIFFWRFNLDKCAIVILHIFAQNLIILCFILQMEKTRKEVKTLGNSKLKLSRRDPKILVNVFRIGIVEYWKSQEVV